MPTSERLKEVIEYDPETGLFCWKMSAGKNNGHKGRLAGNVAQHGYVQIKIDYKVYYAHRLAFLYMTGVWPTKFIDHLNRNRSDNRWVNLREADRSVNALNSGPNTKNKSGVKGVSVLKNGRFKVYYRGAHLGYHDTLEEATRARSIEEDKHGPG